MGRRVLVKVQEHPGWRSNVPRSATRRKILSFSSQVIRCDLDLSLDRWILRVAVVQRGKSRVGTKPARQGLKHAEESDFMARVCGPGHVLSSVPSVLSYQRRGLNLGFDCRSKSSPLKLLQACSVVRTASVTQQPPRTAEKERSSFLVPRASGDASSFSYTRSNQWPSPYTETAKYSTSYRT